MKRAVLSFPLVVLACNGKATHADCTEMLDKYLDMTILGEADVSNLAPADARAAQASLKASRKATSTHRRVQQQCESEISRREFRCAMKAPTPETWQACID